MYMTSPLTFPKNPLLHQPFLLLRLIIRKVFRCNSTIIPLCVIKAVEKASRVFIYMYSASYQDKIKSLLFC